MGSVAIADGSVGTADLAAKAVGGGADPRTERSARADIADGSLDARDFGRFFGRFRENVPEILPSSCWSAEPTGLAPERAGADISQDLVVVTPDLWPGDQAVVHRENSGDSRRFVLSACNRTGTPGAVQVGFRYIVIDLPSLRRRQRSRGLESRRWTWASRAAWRS